MQATFWKFNTMGALFHSGQMLPISSAVASATFIVVRGCDNIREALKKKETGETQKTVVTNSVPLGR
jgi:hypothetical protein